VPNFYFIVFISESYGVKSHISICLFINRLVATKIFMFQDIYCTVLKFLYTTNTLASTSDQQCCLVILFCDAQNCACGKLEVILKSNQCNLPVPVAARSKALACCDRGFESHPGLGCLCVVSVVCCQVDVTVTDWSFVQMSPTDCGASFYVIKKPRKRRG